VAGALFVIDGVFFTLTLAQRTYFQKIADPADMAATTSVAASPHQPRRRRGRARTFGALGMIDPAIISWRLRGERPLTCFVPRAAASHARPRDGAGPAATATGGVSALSPAHRDRSLRAPSAGRGP
jgi:hypothetical protein